MFISPLCPQSLPRILADSLQRSDGEEEEDGSLTLSPVSHDSSPDSGLLHWEGLTLPLPVTFEQEVEDGVSVSLGDLVRHMHPYCMAICMENDGGEQMLPEGGILLEVVDQGENGEPILAIPDMELPVPLPCEESLENEKVSDEADDGASDTSEHIVVDDEDETFSEAPVKVATQTPCSDVKDEMIVKRQKEEIKEKSPSRRKKKKKSKEQDKPEAVEGRVLRSGTVSRKTVQESPKKPEKRSVKEEKKQKVPKVPLASTSASSAEKPKKLTPCQTETQITTTTLSPEMNVQVATSVSPHASPEKPSTSPTTMSPQQPDEMPQQSAPAPEKLEEPSAAPSAVLPPVSSETPTAALSPATPETTPPVSEAPAVPEPKPKSLSLAEYRRLRQQKKPAPVEKQDDNSTKWPSLPELPKELPPIPCLPHPSPKDPRRPNPQAADEVRPAWQPRGPCAPPTPEALLVPPAYMVASSSKATPVPKPQQTPEAPKPSLPQNPSASTPDPVKSLPTNQHTAAQPAAPSVPQSSPAPSKDGKCSPAVSGGKSGVEEMPQSQPESLKSVTKTTTEAIKPTAAAVSALLKTIVSQKVPEVAAPVSLNNPNTLDSKSSKLTPNGTQLCSSLATHPSDSQSLKAQPVVLETQKKPTTAAKPQKAKSPTQELIEAFTSEIGELTAPFPFY